MDSNVENGKIIKASSIKKGDLFEYKGNMEVAIEDNLYGFLWVTNEDIYLSKKKEKYPFYTYTTACIIEINPEDEVRFIKNLDS